MARFRWLLVLPCLLIVSLSDAAPPTGYQAKVMVTAPTRLDWTFALSNRSLAEPPADWLGNYDSTSQSFELFVPPRRDPKQLLPVIVFISPSNQPSGWKAFEGPCKQLGFVFVGVRDAGNECPIKRRVRIVLDALDEVRRLLPTDPDRTYLAGFSGGGRIATAIAFALPEHFGGVMPICAGGKLREESWLRQRVADRLSVAVLTGQNDFNRGEVERLTTPYLKDVGVRARSWTQPGLGHGIPGAGVLVEALSWLDEAAPKRRDLAKRQPASRIAGAAGPGRDKMAQALLAEGKERLKAKNTLYSGLMQLKGVMDRWPDLPAGEEAKKTLLEFEDRKERPWEVDDLAEQRRFLIAMTRALDAYASGDLPKQYLDQRPDMLRQAIAWWKQIQSDSPDSPAGKEALKRIPVLEKLLSSSDR